MRGTGSLLLSEDRADGTGAHRFRDRVETREDSPSLACFSLESPLNALGPVKAHGKVVCFNNAKWTFIEDHIVVRFPCNRQAGQGPARASLLQRQGSGELAP